ncbi:hypothetical protein GGX14DRAFT_667703 [Mycena pura]|uniref:Uncharacterized protein n=1 Tax=Mycena pura TaxID=153505 RepID=A0AAD6Y272_9AGAR|nr:hypothetical protein GGX14DRAFT_667703 [Mycena pura]
MSPQEMWPITLDPAQVRLRKEEGNSGDSDRTPALASRAPTHRTPPALVFPHPPLLHLVRARARTQPTPHALPRARMQHHAYTRRPGLALAAPRTCRTTPALSALSANQFISQIRTSDVAECEDREGVVEELREVRRSSGRSESPTPHTTPRARPRRISPIMPPHRVPAHVAYSSGPALKRRISASTNDVRHDRDQQQCHALALGASHDVRRYPCACARVRSCCWTRSFALSPARTSCMRCATRKCTGMGAKPGRVHEVRADARAQLMSAATATASRTSTTPCGGRGAQRQPLPVCLCAGAELLLDMVVCACTRACTRARTSCTRPSFTPGAYPCPCVSLGRVHEVRAGVSATTVQQRLPHLPDAPGASLGRVHARGARGCKLKRPRPAAAPHPRAPRACAHATRPAHTRAPACRAPQAHRTCALPMAKTRRPGPCRPLPTHAAHAAAHRLPDLIFVYRAIAA